MNNQNLQQNNAQQIQFENLKTLQGYLAKGGDIQTFAISLARSKKALEAFCKTLKDKDAALSKERVAQSAPETAAITVEPEVEAVIEKKSAREEYKRVDSAAKPAFNRDRQNTNFQGKNTREQDGKFSKKPFDPSRPFNKSEKAPNGTQKPRTSGLLPKSDVADTIIVAKPERNFGNKNKTKQIDSDRKELSKKAKIKMGYVDIDDHYGMDDDTRVIGRLRQKKAKKEAPKPEKIVIEKATITTDNLTVKLLSEKLGKPAAELIKKFMMLGMMPNINSVVDFETAELVANEFGIELERKLEKNYEEKLEEMFNNQGSTAANRPPIVTVMGHVDHGKTMLLDTIKQTNVVSSEAGGITQHIGAYSIEVNGNKITFIDTPGHEAFTSMRARGAQITDVAILVVAADDGIMPQTVEAINHIKAAKVPMIVAINKVDKPEANIDRVKQQLTEYDVLPEEWGGDTICVPISAKFNQNIDKLLEMVLLVSEMADLRADESVAASGHIIESKIDKGRGIVATIIVKNGTLHIGDFVVSGVASGRIRAMMDYTGRNVAKATPSMAVSVLGFNVVPEAGDLVHAVDEKMAKNIIEERSAKLQIEKAKHTTGITLEDFLQQSADNEIKVLNIIVKADVKGSAEALKQTLEKIENEEVKVKVIHNAVGGINESDVLLAQASSAIIIGFNVRPEAKAKQMAEKEGIDIKLYRIIYDAVDDVTAAINGMLTIKYEEKVIGHVEVRQTFKISSVGTIAGSYVLDGVVNNKSKVRLLRSNIVIAETEIDTLQQGKNESKTVKAGYECGIKLRNYNDIKVGDVIEVYEMQEVERK